MKAFRHFLSSDAIPLVLTIIYAIITAILAALFKSDTFNLLAYRSFSVNDKSLSYTHVKSVISGNLNIVITTLYSVSVTHCIRKKNSVLPFKLIHPLLQNIDTQLRPHFLEFTWYFSFSWYLTWCFYFSWLLWFLVAGIEQDRAGDTMKCRCSDGAMYHVLQSTS